SGTGRDTSTRTISPGTGSSRRTGRRGTRITGPTSGARWAGTCASGHRGRALRGQGGGMSRTGESGRLALHRRPRSTWMTVLALTGGDIALIVLAVGWLLRVLFLCFVLLNTFRVLESTKMTIDALREETIPLLREVKTSVEKTNREIDRVDIMLDSANQIVGRVEKLSGLVEEAASSPVVKVIRLGAGSRQGFSKAAGKSGGRDPRV